MLRLYAVIAPLNLPAMGSFAAGLLLGCLASLIVGGLGAVMVYRRVLALQRRTVQAERLAELGTLTGGLAHEIKNPLSTVQLNLQLLSEDLDPRNPAYARLTNRLRTVQQEASRLKDILDDFLRYGGRMEIDPRPTELNGKNSPSTSQSPACAIQTIVRQIKSS